VDTVATPVIRLAGVRDLDRIMALETEAFPRGWSATSWTQEIRDHYVAIVDEGVGVIAMSEVAGTAELLRVIVSSGARGHGLGRALVSHGLEWASCFKATEVFLEVSHTNQIAIRLYESLGFTLLDRRVSYYGPGDDALVYRRVIPSADPVIPSTDPVILTQSGSPAPDVQTNFTTATQTVEGFPAPGVHNPITKERS